MLSLHEGVSTAFINFRGVLGSDVSNACKGLPSLTGSIGRAISSLSSGKVGLYMKLIECE